MANTGIIWVDWLFEGAVSALYWLAGLLGTTYEEVNVWLFCVAWPAITIVQTIWIIRLLRQKRRTA
jgi:hypothetical protein